MENVPNRLYSCGNSSRFQCFGCSFEYLQLACLAKIIMYYLQHVLVEKQEKIFAIMHIIWWPVTVSNTIYN